jgi:hypothetical protein
MTRVAPKTAPDDPIEESQSATASRILRTEVILTRDSVFCMTESARTLILETVGDRLSSADVDALADAVTQLRDEERSRCAKMCRDRMELWRNTALAKSSLPAARDEARARANEAQYLADAIETPS